MGKALVIILATPVSTKFNIKVKIKTGSINLKGGEKVVPNKPVAKPIADPIIKTITTACHISRPYRKMSMAAKTFDMQMTPPKDKSSPAGIK